jgi:hypothetical protein
MVERSRDGLVKRDTLKGAERAERAERVTNR